jgi:hypothetical protein
MKDVTPACIRSAIGPAYEDNFLFLPADGTRGGIVFAAKSGFLHIANSIKTNHTISAEVTNSRNSRTWTITRVYIPHEILRKKFLSSLRKKKPFMGKKKMFGLITTISIFAKTISMTYI